MKPASQALNRRRETGEPDHALFGDPGEILSMVANCARIGFWRLDLCTDQVTWSDEIYRIYGLDPRSGPPTLQIAIDGYHPEDREPVRNALRKAIAAKTGFEFFLRVIQPSGMVRHITSMGQCELGPDGEVIGLFGVFKDITERRLTEQRLRRDEERFRVIAEAAPFPFFMARACDGRLLYSNERARHLFLLGDQDLDSVFDLAFPPDALRASFADIRADGLIADRELEFIDSRERVFWASVSGKRAEFDGHDAVCLTITDIDERRRYAKSLEAARDVLRVQARELRETALAEENARQEAEAARMRAELADRSKSDFLAMMSHEIRTPMNGVLGMAGLLSAGDLAPAQRECVDIIRESGATLIAIINDILEYSRLEAGGVVLEKQPFGLREWATRTVTLMAAKGAEKSLTVSLKIADDAPDNLIADKSRIRQVLVNLLSNAVKFTDQGEINVSLEVVEGDGGVHELVGEVSDTGIGIAPDAQSQLFERFKQADSSIARRFGGAGLGLSICKQLLELMGGRIWLESVPDVGSKFGFSVPVVVADGPADASRPPPGPSLGASDGLRVLVAEDNAINQKVVAGILEQLGFDFVLVEDGAEALEAARGGDFDVVLMDIRMPRMDGLAATREIRKLEDAAGRVPVIALTANASEQDRQACVEAGLTGHVDKPIDPGELLAEIRRLAPAAADCA
ncbi:MAG: ATP-binding protein [Pseudomonadota bacterium]